MAAFLFVPGAWLGRWCWRDVAAPLRAAGHRVITATLTGLGERSHRLSPQVGLDTHVSDILALVHYRELTNLTLVGQSYGGAYIPAVAERLPDPLARRGYLAPPRRR